MGRSKSEPRVCGATTRSGGSCRAYAVRNAGDGRCRHHGGQAPEAQHADAATRRPSRNADERTPSAETSENRDDSLPPYGGAVLPGEASLFASLPVGSVDEELRLCRLRLSRAAAAEAELIANGESEGLSRIQDEINRITARIERFESRRSQLIALASAADGGAADDQRIAEAIRAALEEIEALTAPRADRADDDADA